jgi:hypothetical protein
MECAIPTGKKFARQSRAAEAVSCASHPRWVMPAMMSLQHVLRPGRARDLHYTRRSEEPC